MTEFNAIEALFIATCYIILSTLILLQFFNLSAAIIINCILIGVFLIYGLIKSIRTKHLLDKIKTFFFNPSIVILFLSVLLYAVIMNGSYLTGFDNFSHWARVPKIVLEYNSLKIPSNILYYPQTMFTPTFYTFTCFFGGYSFTNILVSLWFLYWIMILLPVSHMNFKKAHLLMLYSLLLTGILLSDKANSTQALADTLIALTAAALLGYYFSRKDFSGRYIILFVGIAVFPNIKYTVGYLFASFILLIMLYDIYSKKKKINLKEAVFFIASLVSFALNKLLMMATNTNLNQLNPISTDMLPYDSKAINYIDIKEPWCDPIGNFLRALTTPIGIIFCCIVAAILAIFIYRKVKKKRLHWSLFFLTLILMCAFIGYAYFTFDAEVQLLIKNFVKNSLHIKYLYMNIIIYLFVLAVVCLLIYRFSSTRPEKKYMLWAVLIAAAQIILYEAGVLVYYSQIQQRLIFSGNSLDRYHGMVIYMLSYFICITAINGNIFSDSKAWSKKSAYALGIVFSIALLFPGISSLIENPENSNNSYHSAVGGYKYYNDLIDEHAAQDERVCMVIDTINIGDWNATKFVTVMIGYHTSLPLNNIVVLNTVSDVKSQKKAFEQYLIENKIEKVITVATGSYFFNVYSELFGYEIDKALDGMFDVAINESGEPKLIYLNREN